MQSSELPAHLGGMCEGLSRSPSFDGSQQLGSHVLRSRASIVCPCGEAEKQCDVLDYTSKGNQTLGAEFGCTVTSVLFRV